MELRLSQLCGKHSTPYAISPAQGGRVNHSMFWCKFPY